MESTGRSGTVFSWRQAIVIISLGLLLWPHLTSKTLRQASLISPLPSLKAGAWCVRKRKERDGTCSQCRQANLRDANSVDIFMASCCPWNIRRTPCSWPGHFCHNAVTSELFYVAGALKKSCEAYHFPVTPEACSVTPNLDSCVPLFRSQPPKTT